MAAILCRPHCVNLYFYAEHSFVGINGAFLFAR